MSQEPGGFIQTHLPSPAPSTPASASTATPSVLPRPRTHPLRAGSAKETSVINHLDAGVLRIQRRHAKKFSSVYENENRTQHEGGKHEGGELDEVEGYNSFKEMAEDIESLVNVVWVSGTRMFLSLFLGSDMMKVLVHVLVLMLTVIELKASLQIPYTISLAVLVSSSLPDYPFTPRSTFRILRKLDAVFASLLLGEDVDAGTGSPLPGFETRRGVVSMTEKVRIKSIAESCRMVVMEVRGGGGGDSDNGGTEGFDVDESDTGGEGLDDDDDDYGGVDDEEPGRWEMEAARVYERTIQILGDELGREGFAVDDGPGCG